MHTIRTILEPTRGTGKGRKMTFWVTVKLCWTNTSCFKWPLCKNKV